MAESTELPVANPAAELPPTPPAPQPAPLLLRCVTLIAMLVPVAGVVVTPFYVWGRGFGWTDLWLLIGMYVVTSLGITIGFHRLFVHRSFETWTWLKFIIAVFGSMAVEGSLLDWVGMHRRHHQYSDTPHDPHTPHHHGTGAWGAIKGLWHAHIGWCFDANPPDLERYTKDLAAVPALRVVSAWFPMWIVLGLLIPALIGGLVSRSWWGAWTAFLWGGLVRVFIVHHVTWSINSACHLWGRQPFHSRDMSRNNLLFGFIGMGEGWHNTHHAFPHSVRHGLRWWQLDLSYWIIRLMAAVGLAWNLKVPSQGDQLRVLRQAGVGS